MGVREKHLLVALRYMDQLGIEPPTFWCMGRHCRQLRHPARAMTMEF